MLKRMAKNHQLSEDAVKGMLEAPDPSFMPVPSSPESTRQWLNAMADVILADGEIAREEEEALLALGRHIGWVSADVRLLLNKRKAYLYREASLEDR